MHSHTKCIVHWSLHANTTYTCHFEYSMPYYISKPKSRTNLYIAKNETDFGFVDFDKSVYVYWMHNKTMFIPVKLLSAVGPSWFTKTSKVCVTQQTKVIVIERKYLLLILLVSKTYC